MGLRFCTIEMLHVSCMKLTTTTPLTSSFEPLVCGEKECPYSNLCIAELAGYSSDQCSTPEDECPESTEDCSTARRNLVIHGHAVPIAVLMPLRAMPRERVSMLTATVARTRGLLPFVPPSRRPCRVVPQAGSSAPTLLSATPTRSVTMNTNAAALFLMPPHAL